MTGRPGSGQERFLQLLVSDCAAHTGSRAFAVWGIKERHVNIDTDSNLEFDELYNASQWEPVGNYHNEVVIENSL